MVVIVFSESVIFVLQPPANRFFEVNETHLLKHLLVQCVQEAEDERQHTVKIQWLEHGWIV